MLATENTLDFLKNTCNVSVASLCLTSDKSRCLSKKLYGILVEDLGQKCERIDMINRARDKEVFD